MDDPYPEINCKKSSTLQGEKKKFDRFFCPLSSDVYDWKCVGGSQAQKMGEMKSPPTTEINFTYQFGAKFA